MNNLALAVDYNPSFYTISQYDPTRTTTLRNQFAGDMRVRFSKLCTVIRKAIVDEDCFATETPPGFLAMANMATPGRHAFDFARSADKVAAFMAWLKKQETAGVLEIIAMPRLGRPLEEAWTDKYIQAAYQRGIMRARQELMGVNYIVPSIEGSGGITAAFNMPIHLERVGLVYTRVYEGLKGITASMDTQISRVLAQAMAEGKNPREMAKLLVKTITGPVGDLGITDTLGRFIPAKRRAEVLARTEIIRAHHVATIQEYRNWAIEGVKVRAEWQTAEDSRVCPECSAMQGRVYTLDEIEGKIPLHPQCRCVALPLSEAKEEELGEKEIIARRRLPPKKEFGTSPVSSISNLPNEIRGVNEAKIVLFRDGTKAKPELEESKRLKDRFGGTFYNREVAAY